jgi:hypothetical protein
MLFDLSGSIGSNIGDLKNAGKKFVDALTGTPSSVGLYTFASHAPANTSNNANHELTPVSTHESAAKVNARISGLTVQGGNAGATNWDTGLGQIAADTTKYDVALVLTDGNPTVYGPSAQGPGSYTRFIEAENGIFSANALKAKGTTVLGVGIGSVGRSKANLASISGPREGTDFFATDFVELASLLTKLALKNCQGTVNVVKQVVPASAPGDLAAASPAPGWHFTAQAPEVEPRAGHTDENGAISFATATSSSQPVTITETEQDGYQLIRPGGQNASCKNSAGHAVPVTNAPGAGFTVDALANQSVTCVVYNQELARPDPASVVVTKSWDIDGVTHADGDQNPNFQASLTLHPIHPPGTQPVWGHEYEGYLEGDEVSIGEGHVTIPAGCTSHPSGALGPHPLGPGVNRFHITNTVTCRTELTLIKRIDNPFTGVTLAPLTSWTLSARTAAGEPPAVEGTTGVSGRVTAGTRYVLSETTVPGYQQHVVPGSTLAPGASGSWRCVQLLGHGRTGLEVYTGADGTVVVQPGEHVACTAVNIPQPAALTLVKHVSNDHGGTAAATDWTLIARPGEHVVPPAPELSGVTGSPEVTGAEIPPGVPYALGEAGPAGYRLTGLSCVVTTPSPTSSPTPAPTGPTPTATPTRPGPEPTFPEPSGGAGTGGGTASGLNSPLVLGGLAAAALGGIGGIGLAVRRRRGSSGP